MSGVSPGTVRVTQKKRVPLRLLTSNDRTHCFFYVQICTHYRLVLSHVDHKARTRRKRAQNRTFTGKPPGQQANVAVSYTPCECEGPRRCRRMVVPGTPTILSSGNYNNESLELRWSRSDIIKSSFPLSGEVKKTKKFESEGVQLLVSPSNWFFCQSDLFFVVVWESNRSTGLGVLIIYYTKTGDQYKLKSMLQV